MTQDFRQFGAVVKKDSLSDTDFSYIKQLFKESVYHRGKMDYYDGKPMADHRVRRCWTTQSKDLEHANQMMMPLFEWYLDQFNITLDPAYKKFSFIESYFIKYDAQDLGFLDWHQDVLPGQDIPRTISLSLIIDRNFSGGELLLSKNDNTASFDNLDENSCVLFLPNIKHKINPVTQGTRKVLVAWFRCTLHGDLQKHLQKFGDI